MSYDSAYGQSDSFGYAAGQEEISLDLGVDTTEGVSGGIVPIGTHLFRVQGYDIQFSSTEYSETMVVLQLIVEQSRVGGAVGTSKSEYIVIPGDTRKENDYKKWATMMRMLRMKLEAITGHPWREDNISLRPRELVNCYFVATVIHESNTYKDKNTGELKQGTQAQLQNWQAVQAQPEPQPQQTLQGAGVIPPSQPQPNGQPQPVQQEPQVVQQPSGETQQPTQQTQQPAPTVTLPQQNVNEGVLGPWNPNDEPF